MMPLQFNQIIDFIFKETGINLPPANYRFVEQFISERLQKLNKTLDIYLVLLKNNQNEYDQFLDAVTINETYFFREEKQFQVIENHIFPNFLKQGVHDLNIWRAACSSGEEAVSIAILAEKRWQHTYSVMASDINPAVLNRLEKGLFKPNSYRVDGAMYHPLMSEFIRHKKNTFILKPKILDKIKICQMNLFKNELLAYTDRFHLVFLRNMLVYMPLDIRQTILNYLVKTIPEGGYLFLSSSETPLISHPNLKLSEYSGIFFFQKKNIEEKKKGFSINHKTLISELNKTKQKHKQKNKNKPQLIQNKETEVRRNIETKNRQIKKTVNINEILRFANQKINNQTFVEVDNDDYEIALEFIDIVVSINNHHCKEAQKRLERVQKEIRTNELT